MIGAVAIALLLLASDASLAQSWQVQSSPTGVPLRAVWGTGASDVFAVGDDGVVLHFDGAAWSSMGTPTPHSLHGVWGSSGSDVWAVGLHGVMLKYEGTEWVETTNTLDHWHRNLRSVFGFAPDDVFAAGGYGAADRRHKWRLVMRYDGSAWTAVSRGGETVLHSVWGASPSSVFAVGGTYAEGALALHFDGTDGTDWTALPTPFPQPLVDVRGSAPDDVYAAGIAGLASGGGIFRWDGTAWTQVVDAPESFHGLAVRSAGDVWAVGTGGTILHWDGSSWDPSASGVSSDLLAIWSAPTGELFAVGAGGRILRRAAP